MWASDCVCPMETKTTNNNNNRRKMYHIQDTQRKCINSFCAFIHIHSHIYIWYFYSAFSISGDLFFFFFLLFGFAFTYFFSFFPRFVHVFVVHDSSVLCHISVRVQQDIYVVMHMLQITWKIEMKMKTIKWKKKKNGTE